jgi:hypothetical protein
MKTFLAKYPGRCRLCPRRIAIGEPIVRSQSGGYAHEACAIEATEASRYDSMEGVRPEYRMADDPILTAERDWETARMERENAEYAAGVEDARRYRETSQMFGEAYAAQMEFERDLRGLNGDW